MHLLRYAALLSSLRAHGVLADYLMGSHPPPFDISSDNSLVAAAWKNVSTLFDTLTNSTNSTAATAGIKNVTFSAGVFSIYDPAAINLQYHYTSPSVASSPYGTNKVDENSIYMVASVSKLITVFTGMLSLSLEDWNRPVTEINPQFQQLVEQNLPANVVYNIPWDQITPWALATQLSGVPTLGIILPQADNYNASLTALFGAPLANTSTFGECYQKYFTEGTNFKGCDVPEALTALAITPPNNLPWSTPVYSDLGYMLLGSLIANITNNELTQVYRDAVFNPLGMDSTSDLFQSDNASVARSVIPNSEADYDLFSSNPGFTVPSGGIRSTISDLQKLGIGIMNNTLLSANATRKWMKPVSNTPSLTYAVGGPWEIHRYVHPTTQRVTELYTKLGDSGSSGAAVCIIPQYGAGFTFANAALATDASRSLMALYILDFITETILPALEAQAQAEAAQKYTGTYSGTNANGVNASVTIEFNSTLIPYLSHSGLQISKWTYNGTDVIAAPIFNGNIPRLEPTIDNRVTPDSPGQVAFQATTSTSELNALTYMDAMQVPGTIVQGSWSGLYYSYGDFAFTDNGDRWAGVQTTLIVFDVDADGNATAVTPAVDKVTLKRGS